MIGHSIGEYVAACLAGVFSLEDGLHLSAIRGRLMGEMSSGSMLSVAVAADTLSLPTELELAAINGPEQCVVSGPTDAVQKFAGELEKRAVPCRLLHTSHAFHSAMMDPMLESFRAHLAKVSLRAPKIPYLSNVTGTWITAAEATDPELLDQAPAKYRALLRRARRIVPRPGAGISGGWPRPSARFVDAPAPWQAEKLQGRSFHAAPAGTGLRCGVPAQHHGTTLDRGSCRLTGMRSTPEKSRTEFLFQPTRSNASATGSNLGRKVLASEAAEVVPSAAAPSAEAAQSEQWFHRRVWKKSPAEKTAPADHACWLLFLDETGLGREISKQLKTSGHEVLEVVAGDKYKRRGAGSYAIRPGVRDDYDELLKDIVKREHPPTRILHLWPVTGATAGRSLDQTLDLSFYSLLFLAQAWGDQDLGAVEIACVSNGLQSVSGENVVEPARAALLGPVRVIPKEFPGAFCRSIDLDRNIQDLRRTASDIIAECSLRSADSCVAYRQSERWVETFESTNLRTQTSGTRLREKGVYLIVGGLGGIGLVVAEHLARTVHARLVLVGRTPLPPASEWQAVLDKPNGANGARARQTIAKLREIESSGRRGSDHFCRRDRLQADGGGATNCAATLRRHSWRDPCRGLDRRCAAADQDSRERCSRAGAEDSRYAGFAAGARRQQAGFPPSVLVHQFSRATRRAGRLRCRQRFSGCVRRQPSRATGHGRELGVVGRRGHGGTEHCRQSSQFWVGDWFRPRPRQSTRPR